MEPRFVTCETVKELIEGPLAGSTCVVDVREDDFVGGHVPGAVNCPVDEFHTDEGIDAVVARHLEGKERVVLHCMMSQQRGPFAARALAARLRALGRMQPSVLVMQGGFQRWSRLGFPTAH